MTNHCQSIHLLAFIPIIILDFIAGGSNTRNKCFREALVPLDTWTTLSGIIHGVNAFSISFVCEKGCETAHVFMLALNITWVVLGSITLNESNECMNAIPFLWTMAIISLVLHLICCIVNTCYGFSKCCARY